MILTRKGTGFGLQVRSTHFILSEAKDLKLRRPSIF